MSLGSRTALDNSKLEVFAGFSETVSSSSSNELIIQLCPELRRPQECCKSENYAGSPKSEGMQLSFT